jgi:hypothetical protein
MGFTSRCHAFFNYLELKDNDDYDMPHGSGPLSTSLLDITFPLSKTSHMLNLKITFPFYPTREIVRGSRIIVPRNLEKLKVLKGNEEGIEVHHLHTLCYD